MYDLLGGHILSFYPTGSPFSRLLVFLSAILTPIYFIILISRSPIELSFLEAFFKYFAMPLTFSFPWLLFIYINRNTLAATFDEIKSATSILPLRWKIFYGINAIFILLFFVLPFISPPLAVFTAIILAVRVTRKSKFILERSEKTPFLISFILAIAFASIPSYFLLLFLPAYSIMFSWILDAWWDSLFLIYDLSIWIVNSLAIGSLIWLIYTGAAEYETRIYGWKKTQVPVNLIRLIQFLFFLFLAFIGLPLPRHPLFKEIYEKYSLPIFTSAEQVLSAINILCLIIVCFVILTSLIRGLKKVEYRGPFIGYLFAAGFLIIDIFWRFNKHLITFSIILASIMFFLIFIYCFESVKKEIEG